MGNKDIDNVNDNDNVKDKDNANTNVKVNDIANDNIKGFHPEPMADDNDEYIYLRSEKKPT